MNTHHNIIIAEKPSVMRTYAEILGANNKENGYAEGNGWIVTCTFGHLIEMLYPDAYDESLKKWQLETLPFIPKDYKYGVIHSVVKQYKVVKDLYNGKIFPISAIYYAGDSGREGLYIQMLVRMMAGHKPGVEERVVWIDSQTEAEVKRGIREAKPISAYKNLSDAGYMRAIEDYLIGMNFSRALSVKYGALIQTSSEYRPFAVGRVMTCVLGMIVDLEKRIRAFKPTPFYRIVASVPVDNTNVEMEWKATEKSKYFESPILYKNNGFLNQDNANAFISTLMPSLKVVDVQHKEEKKSAPLLFNLAELQAECTKRFHISPDKTLEIAQSLYEKKLTTYPRTDARVLTTAIAMEIDTNLNGLAGSQTFSKTASYILSSGLQKGLEKTKYTDDSKVTDHYAIIPTGVCDTSRLEDIELDVYELICRRFLSIFLPPAIYRKIQIEAASGNESFFVGGKVLVSKGYLGLYASEEDKDNNMEQLQALAKIHEGDILSATYSTAKGETTPPKRYTSGNLILAMENAGKLIEEEELREQIKGSGIGTSATRGDIIKKLVSNGFIRINSKTQIVEPEDVGFMVYEVVKATVPSLLSPTMTASWEKGLSGIENGSISYAEYRGKMEKYVRDTIAKIKAEDHTKESVDALAALGITIVPPKKTGELTDLVCPSCGGHLKTSKYGYICENWKKDDPNACQFGIGEIAGKKLTEEQVRKLVTNKEVGPLKGFKKKNGGTFEATLIIQDGKVAFKPFEQKDYGTDEPTSIQCPRCQNPLQRNNSQYHCACGYKLWYTIAGKSLSETTVLELLKTGHTEDEINGFVSKKGKRFAAKLKYGNEKIEFDFPEAYDTNKKKGSSGKRGRK